jgi:protein SCO1/2
MREIDPAGPLVDILAHVAVLRRGAAAGALVDLLREQAAIYAGRSSAEAERLRGHVLASFEMTGLPNAALPMIVEELEFGINPFTVAAAARGARGGRDLPELIVVLLLDSIHRIRGCDDVVRFDAFADGRDVPPTAVMELLRTLAWLGPRARAALPALHEMAETNPLGFSAPVLAELRKAVAAVSQSDQQPACCPSAEEAASTLTNAPTKSEIADLELQDQAGRIFRFAEFFRGRPSAVTFFYTRCMNPNKCSLTITKLGRLQRRLAGDGLIGLVNVAAISYDPGFDLPHRLSAYGANRGMTFDDRNRLLRTTGRFQPLQHHFDLGVGYGGTTVNQHRLELMVLDRDMRPHADFVRRQWQEDDVLELLRSAVTK